MSQKSPTTSPGMFFWSRSSTTTSEESLVSTRTSPAPLQSLWNLPLMGILLGPWNLMASQGRRELDPDRCNAPCSCLSWWIWIMVRRLLVTELKFYQLQKCISVFSTDIRLVLFQFNYMKGPKLGIKLDFSCVRLALGYFYWWLWCIVPEILFFIQMGICLLDSETNNDC